MHIRQLVATHLRPRYEESILLETELTVAIGDQAAPIAAEAAAGCGLGLDHFGGEHVLAGVLCRETPRHYEHRRSYAITDRRILASGWSSMKGGFNDLGFSLRLDQIARVEYKNSLFANYIKIFDQQGREHELLLAEANEQGGPLFQALGQLHPQARGGAPIAMPQPHEGDPAAAAAANQCLWRSDPMVTAALMQIDQLVRSGQLDGPGGYDFVCRLLLLHRSGIGGPGSNGQFWLSPMIGSDLAHSLARIYGPPVGQERDAANWTWYHFRVDPNNDALSPALTALGVAAFVGLGFGFSPGSVIADQLMKKQPITGIRLGVSDQSGCSLYVLDAGQARLEQSDALMAHGIHQALIHASYQVMERRCQLGWGVEYSQLF